MNTDKLAATLTCTALIRVGSVSQAGAVAHEVVFKLPVAWPCVADAPAALASAASAADG